MRGSLNAAPKRPVIALLARNETALQREIVKGQRPERTLKIVIVPFVHDMGLRRIEVFEKQMFWALAVVIRTGQEHLEAIVKFMAVSHPAFVSIKTGGFARHLAAVLPQIAPLARDHVDHPKKSVVAIGAPSTSAQLCFKRAEQQQTGGQIPTNKEGPLKRIAATDRVHGFGLVETSPECLRPATLHQMMADLLHSARRSLEKWADMATGSTGLAYLKTRPGDPPGELL